MTDPQQQFVEDLMESLRLIRQSTDGGVPPRLDGCEDVLRVKQQQRRQQQSGRVNGRDRAAGDGGGRNKRTFTSTETRTIFEGDPEW